MLESCEYLTSKIVNNIVLNPQTLNIFVANNFDVPDARINVFVHKNLFTSLLAYKFHLKWDHW